MYRAARNESARLVEQGATIRRVRIDAEMKKQIARAGETARQGGGRGALEGRTGRVNVEVASEHYRSGSIVSKAAAGFEMHGNGGRATANIQRAGPGPGGTWDARSISSNARSAAGKGSRNWPTS